MPRDLSAEGLGTVVDLPYHLRMAPSNTGPGAPSSGGLERDPTSRIRLLLLDDHLLVRDSLAVLLASEHDFELVEACTASTEALTKIKSSEVDVVLVDLAIAEEFLLGARKAQYRGRTLVIARDIDAMHSAAVLKCGASGIFLDSNSSARLVQAIRLVANGEAWVDKRVIQILAERYPHYEHQRIGALTDREQTVLQGVVDGLSNRKIGAQIGVSESAIKAALQNLFSRAGVRTRSQLVRIALERPLLDIPNPKEDRAAGLSAESYG
jgi:DNA-binding NarL/FixJ family response regulator